MKILLVEDDNYVRMVLKRHLEDGGHMVDDKACVDEAMEALDNNEKYNLLITDILMPHKDGGYLMKYIISKKIKLPILAITGGFENAIDDYLHYADFFADETMMKPIAKNDLLDTVDRLSDYMNSEEFDIEVGSVSGTA